MKSLPLACALVLFFSIGSQAQAVKKTNSSAGPAKAASNAVSKQPVVGSPAIIPVGSMKCVGNGLTENEMNEILLSHNKIRSSVGLPALKWDCRIGSTAQGWANAGIAGHNGETFYGENIFVASNTGESATLAVDRWAAERGDWTNKPPACTPGKTCTHFTQMVWRQTSRIGCGINRNASGKWKVILVCNYDVEAESGSAY